jgi:hypothetical protein
MSSQFQKIRNRVALRNENAVLRRLYRQTHFAYLEEQQHAADLARALWVAASQNGGQLRITKQASVEMPAGGVLRAYDDTETGDVIFVAHVESPETLIIQDEAGEIDPAVLAAATENAQPEGAEAPSNG